MRTNKRKVSRPIHTHEGAKAVRISPLLQLRRSVMSTFLFEGTFYEDGVSIHDRIMQLAGKVSPSDVSRIAIEAREKANLRHVPLALAYSLTKTAGGTNLPSRTIARVIQRPDELGEFVALYMRDGGRRDLSKQAKLGLAEAFHKFDEYQFSKWDRKDAEWRIRDVMFKVHPKALDADQKVLFKRIADDRLKVADTWEVNLSRAGQTAATKEEKQAGKKEVFERQLRSHKLGYMALLRNLRGMLEADVDEDLIKDAILARKGAARVLPFRFVAAARAAPRLEATLDKALVANIAEMPLLRGRTVVLVDVSGSMKYGNLSAKSDMNHMTAAATLASVLNAEDLRVFSFSAEVVEVPSRRGMAGVDAVIRSQYHGGTRLGKAVRFINETVKHDRLIVVTDEQSHDIVPDPVVSKAYMINVAANRNGVGYWKWTHIDGFSEQVIRFITELEHLDAAGT